MNEYSLAKVQLENNKIMVQLLSLKEKQLWRDKLSLLPKDACDIYFTPEYYALYEQNADGKAFCFCFIQ